MALTLAPKETSSHCVAYKNRDYRIHGNSFCASVAKVVLVGWRRTSSDTHTHTGITSMCT